MVALTIRRAKGEDAIAIAGIANPIIRDTTITFTTAEKEPERVAALIAEGQRHWVAELDGQIIGYATYFPFRSGLGYARTKEHTVGLAPEARGKGGGRGLMEALLEHATAAGVGSMWAGISGENEDGMAFHAALGFQRVALLPRVGWKFDRWHDLVLMVKRLD